MASAPLHGRRAALLALALGLLLGPPGCITRTVRTTVYDRDGVEVELRGQRRGTRALDRGYQHPAVISRERLTGILAAIDIETGEPDERQLRAALATDLIEPVVEGVRQAFEQADPSQEIAVKAVRKERRLGLFHRKYLTSFITFMRDERLFVHLSRVEWEIPKAKEDDKLPEPSLGDTQMAFRAVPPRGMLQAGSQGVSARWRDPAFARPLRPLGPNRDRVRTRSILSEIPIPPEELRADEARALGENLSPATLRALADLEEARLAGEITESEYQTRRNEILESDRAR